MMTDAPDEELLPSEQPPTDDPWVIVTPMPRPAPVEAKVDAEAPARPRRRRTLCPICGAYWACDHGE